MTAAEQDLEDDKKKPSGIFKDVWELMKAAGGKAGRWAAPAGEDLSSILSSRNLLRAGIAGTLGAVGADTSKLGQQWQDNDRRRALQQLAEKQGWVQPGTQLPPGTELQDIRPQPFQAPQGLVGYNPMGGNAAVIPGGEAAKMKMPEHWPTGAAGNLSQSLFQQKHGRPPQTSEEAWSEYPSAQVQVEEAKKKSRPSSVFKDAKDKAWLAYLAGTATPAQRELLSGIKEDKPLGKLAKTVYVNEKGEPAPSGEMTETEAVKHNYKAMDTKEWDAMQSTQQGLTMLNNMAGVFDNLNKKGKLLDVQGLKAVMEQGQLKWLAESGDPDLALAQGQVSEMIATQRTLGDKMRAMEAFSGAIRVISTGKAPYSAISAYFKQLDKALRKKYPPQAPKAYDAYPGARNMGKPNAWVDDIYDQVQQ